MTDSNKNTGLRNIIIFFIIFFAFAVIVTVAIQVSAGEEPLKYWFVKTSDTTGETVISDADTLELIGGDNMNITRNGYKITFNSAATSTGTGASGSVGGWVNGSNWVNATLDNVGLPNSKLHMFNNSLMFTSADGLNQYELQAREGKFTIQTLKGTNTLALDFDTIVFENSDLFIGSVGTNLYEAAVNQLRTDDNFSSAVDVCQVGGNCLSDIGTPPVLSDYWNTSESLESDYIGTDAVNISNTLFIDTLNGRIGINQLPNATGDVLISGDLRFGNGGRYEVLANQCAFAYANTNYCLQFNTDVNEYKFKGASSDMFRIHANNGWALATGGFIVGSSVQSKWIDDSTHGTSTTPIYIGGSAIATSDGTTGGTGSAGSGNQYVELEINGVTYKVLHDGTV